MLRRLSGRTHRVLTAVSLVSAGREASGTVETEVEFAPLSEDDIAEYVGSGEAMGRAGADAIQGGAERFVARLSGSYSGVVGLPLHETAALLRGFGIHARTPRAGGGA